MKKVSGILVFVALAGAALGQEAESLLWKNKALEAELALARTPSVYFVLDLNQKTLAFKSQCALLREWEIVNFGFRRRGDVVQSATLEQKLALVGVKRKRIEPKKVEEIGSYEPEVLEANDMPALYRMTLDNRLTVAVRAGKIRWPERLLAADYFLRDLLQRMGQGIAKLFFDRDAQHVTLELKDAAEAQTLCWSLNSGMQGIVVFPML